MVHMCGMSYEKLEVSQEMCLDTIFPATFSTKNNHLMNGGSQIALCCMLAKSSFFFLGGGHFPPYSCRRM